MVLKAPNGPALWRDILAVMPPGSIIAGGAVRDYFLGVEPKDVDVFTPAQDWKTPRGFYSLGSDSAKLAEYLAMPEIAVVSRGTILGHQVDHVGIHLPDIPAFTGAALVEGFDFAITRSWFVDDELGDTEEAREDRDDKTVTLWRTDRMERAFARFARFNARMGGGYKLAPGSHEIAAIMAGAAL